MFGGVSGLLVCAPSWHRDVRLSCCDELQAALFIAPRRGRFIFRQDLEDEEDGFPGASRYPNYPPSPLASSGARGFSISTETRRRLPSTSDEFQTSPNQLGVANLPPPNVLGGSRSVLETSESLPQLPEGRAVHHQAAAPQSKADSPKSRRSCLYVLELIVGGCSAMRRVSCRTDGSRLDREGHPHRCCWRESPVRIVLFQSHNILFSAAGALLLWIGWYAFNVASVVSIPVSHRAHTALLIVS